MFPFRVSETCFYSCLSSSVAPRNSMMFWSPIFVWGFLAHFSLHFLLLFLAPLLQKFSNDVPQWGFLFLPCPGLSGWKITPFPCENFSYMVRKLPNFPSSFSLFSLSGTIISQISLPGLIFKISDWFFPILYFYTLLPTLLAISLMLPFTVSVEGFISVLLFVVSVLPCCMHYLFSQGFLFVCFCFVPGDSYRHYKQTKQNKTKTERRLCTWFQDGGTLDWGLYGGDLAASQLFEGRVLETSYSREDSIHPPVL